MAEELTKLRKKRGQIRTKLTNFCKFIEAKENNTKVSEIELRLNIIERAFDEFDNIQSDLEILDENEDIERAPTHDLFCEAISLARDILKGNSPSSLTSSNVTQLHLNTPENMLTNDAEAHIRLPTIGLPTFNGSYDKWLNFRDTFTALIHENQRLSNIQKLFYLKSCLQDEAARLIESLQTATENYLIAWDLLKKRYENKRVIVNTHIKALFDLTLNTHNLHFSLRQLLDHLLQHLSALDNLESAEKQRDMLIIHLMYSKLDQKTKVEFENTLQDDNIPTLTDFKDFLTKKCFTLETMHSSSASTLNKFVKLDYKGNKQTQRTFAVTNTENKSKLCLYCQGMHFIFQCSKFVALSVDEKYREVRKLKICSNCLRPGHFKNECKSGNCKICSRDHNTLLHNNNYHKQNSDASQKQDARNQRNPEETQQKQTVAQVVNKETSFESVRTVNASCNRSQVLLSTAHVLIKDQHGTWHDCRALCDSGSQSNLITTALCQTLNLRCESTNVPLAGINENLIEIKQRATTSIKSRFNSFETELNLLVIPKITERLPTTAFDDKLLGYPKTLHLADPEFNKPRSVDILLGADIFFELLCIGQIKLGKHMPTLQKTQLGWIFAGNLNLEQKLNNKLVCNFTGEISNENLNHQLTQFWEIEEIVPQQILTTEEKICEIQFAEDTTRNEQGRYVVKLPFSENLQNLGESKTMALKRFNALESRFDRDTSLKLDYIAFMREYEDLGHMSEQEIFDLDNNEKDYFLPHHAVRKQTSTTTKCRVVFDASAKTDTGISLNDTLLVGPKIQSDLFSIVMRFRLHQLVLSADIKMMFRQILVHEDHQGYQKIIWRYDKTEPLKIYTLKTITYGMASSPYLAQKCLLTLANEYEEMFPRTSQIIKNSFYMDDLLVSVKTKEEAMEIQHELKIILGSAGFHLRKWSSNDKSFLREILGTDDNADNLVQFHDNNPLKTLGLEWNANSDTFHYTIQPNTNLSRITKRTVLSSISQIFDPLGLVGPAIMKAKILMQRLWQLQIGWDESLPSNLHSAWYNFITQLNKINRIHITRQVICNNAIQIEVHGFSDSSETAYGAAIYIRSMDKHGNYFSHLLCAKSRVVPLKKLTIPRLELLAAVLLAKLAQTVKNTLLINIDRITYYCDSTIVLAWLKTDLSILKTFVANRVSKIQELTNTQHWRHIKSELNPADIISRGINPDELENLKLWWHGPEFLVHHNAALAEDINVQVNELPDTKDNKVVLVTTETNDFNIFERFSSLNKLLRVTAYCLRFKRLSTERTSFLTNAELENSLITLVKVSQNQEFKLEIQDLERKHQVSKRSKLISLQPFLDSNRILRVGGRLKNSQLPFEQRHPIILPRKHKLTHLIISNYHLKYLHAGVQNLLSLIRLRFWPIDGKNLVKKIIRTCTTCFRANPKPISFLMGDLPSDRVTPNRAFLKCGLDYAGPIYIKDRTLRNAKLVKTYICVFVCFTTHAIHLELVKDLTTDSFLNALKRFISRRGRPTDVFSDNASNFQGANRQLRELADLQRSEAHNKSISDFFSNDGITWHFIPARSPHMGGLWEAAVKSMKYHLKRVTENSKFTYEEMYTVLTQIEACLNSRPLTPLSNDPSDLLPLTPGHFLIGDSLHATPQHNVLNMKESRLSQYLKLQQAVQSFWKRWSREYLNQLQQRSKWRSTSTTKIQIGALVILVTENVAPQRWPLARIVSLHPGPDCEVRVVTVKMPDGSEFRRSVSKLCILPIDDDLELTSNK